MDNHKPQCNEIDQLVKHIGISDPIHGSEDSQAEECDICHVADLRRNSGNHGAARQSLHQQNQRHYRQNIVMAGERGEPVDGQIVYPDNQNRHVDGQDREHEHEYRVRIVGEVDLCCRPNLSGVSQRPRRGRQLDYTSHHKCELIWYDECNKQQKD